MNKHLRAGLFAAGALSLTLLGAAGYFTPGLPAVTSINGLEQIPLDTGYTNGLNPQTAYVTAKTLAAFTKSQAGANNWNSLIGGDFATNPWQRGTTSSSTTTALLYGADQWWQISGTGTAFTTIKETGASDITGTFLASARVQRTASQTGVIPVCIGQVLTTANSARFKANRAEFDFHAKDGANFSAASANVTATIGYSVAGAADQTAANFQLVAWTGQVDVDSVIPLTTTWTRYSVVANVPSTATQIGVMICYTPVGTAGANDWFEFAGAQLTVNPLAVALDGVSQANGQGGMAASFAHRPAGEELALAQRYFFRLAEPASGAAIPGACQATGASANICNIFLPQPMRAVPTETITTAGTFKVNIAGTPTTIVSPTASTCSTTACAVTAGNTNTAGQAELLSGGGGTGAWDISAEL